MKRKYILSQINPIPAAIEAVVNTNQVDGHGGIVEFRASGPQIMRAVNGSHTVVFPIIN